MSKYMTYPHGFKSLSTREEDDKGVFIYDRDIEALYSAFVNNEVDFNNWDYRSNVLEEAFRLFGANFEEWTLYQINKNTLVYDHALEFLLDTLNFINGSERKVSTFVWRELLLTEPEQKSYVEINNRRINKLRDLFPKIPLTTAQVIKNWCSQENGFEDLIISLFIFFGPSPNLNNKAIQQLKLL